MHDNTKVWYVLTPTTDKVYLIHHLIWYNILVTYVGVFLGTLYFLNKQK